VSTEPGAVHTATIDGYLEGWRDTFHQHWGRPPAPASYRGQINALGLTRFS
jgi:hypothetical protein